MASGKHGQYSLTIGVHSDLFMFSMRQRCFAAQLRLPRTPTPSLRCDDKSSHATAIDDQMQTEIAGLLPLGASISANRGFNSSAGRYPDVVKRFLLAISDARRFARRVVVCAACVDWKLTS